MSEKTREDEKLSFKEQILRDLERVKNKIEVSKKTRLQVLKLLHLKKIQ